VQSYEWKVKGHEWKLCFQHFVIAVLVDARLVLRAIDSLYSRGMAGLMASQEEHKISTSYCDNVLIKGLHALETKVSSTITMPNRSSIYELER
jgi:hypothetical protein